MWLDNPYNASTNSGGVIQVVSVYFLDAQVEDSEYYVGEVPYTSSLPRALEEIAFTETTMVRGFGASCGIGGISRLRKTRRRVCCLCKTPSYVRKWSDGFHSTIRCLCFEYLCTLKAAVSRRTHVKYSYMGLLERWANLSNRRV